MPSYDKTIRIMLSLQDNMSSELNKSASSLKSLGANLSSIGNQMTASLTLPILAAGAAAVKLSMDFDKSLKNIQSISKGTNEETKALGETFKKMSMDMNITVDSAQNLADAFYDIQSSGFSGDDAMKVLEASTKAASAGLTTTKVAAQALTGVLNAYGASANEASRYSDIMFETVNRGVVTFEQLSGALGSVTGLAAQVGVRFEEVGAAVSTMTKQGIDAATATTNLNAILTSLISPTESMSKAFKAMGYESGSAMLATLGLGGTMQKLSEYAGGSAEKMQDLFGNVRALRGALALTGKGAGMFAEDLAAMEASVGATQEAFAIQMQSFAAVWQHFQNVASVALMEAGEIILPFLSQLLNAVSGLLEWFIKLDDTTQSWVIGLLAVVAAIGPILSIVGGLISAFGTLTSIIPVVAAAFTGFMALGAPMIALIGLIIAAVVLLIANWNQLGTTVSQIGTLVAEGWKRMYESAGQAAAQLAEIIGTTLGRLVVIGMVIGKNIIEGMIKGISIGMIKIIAWVQEQVNKISNAVRNAFGIHSPSKVMAKIGEQVVAGFHEGIQSMGGVGVNVPQMSGGQSRQPSLAYAGGGGSGNSGGYGVYINQLIVPPGTTKEQIDFISKELAKRTMRKGAKAGKG